MICFVLAYLLIGLGLGIAARYVEGRPWPLLQYLVSTIGWPIVLLVAILHYEI